jgi:hypothetical protein
LLKACHKNHYVVQMFLGKFCLSTLGTKLLLTGCKQCRPSWQVNMSPASLEILNILWNPKVYYRVHKSPLFVRVLRQTYPVHEFPFRCFKVDLIIYFFFVALRSKAGHGLLILEVFCITHNDAPQPVGLLWTSDQLDTETSTWQHTTLTTDNIHSPGGIWTHDLNSRAHADLHLRPRGHWDRLLII